MLSKVYSCGLAGVEGYKVTVETDVANGLPMVSLVGLPDAGLRESRERVHAAIKNAGFDYPMKKITINLAPADLKKEGSTYDLPIAIGILIASEQLVLRREDRLVIVGELSLSGEIKPVDGILPMVLAAKKNGMSGVIVPDANRYEAGIVEGIAVYPVGNINETVKFLGGETDIPAFSVDVKALLRETSQNKTPDFSEIKGQGNAKRALEIAAAGAHNLLLSGPPGAGKSLLAKAFPSILPNLTLDEALEITKIYSVSGKLPQGGIVTERPFRSPHHTISSISLIGGGRMPKPGEVSLAHLGVLFLDELPEFNKTALEVLRQPMEDQEVTVSRVSATLTYPASFMLIASMNPCRCGYYGDPEHECTCTLGDIKRYTSKISGPLMDRIDIRLEVPATRFDELLSKETCENSKTIKKRVNAARDVQNTRYALNEGIYFNAQLTPPLIEKYCVLGSAEKALMEKIYKKMKLSARGYHRILKLSRTIADLEGSEIIKTRHLSEAVQYRAFEGK